MLASLGLINPYREAYLSSTLLACALLVFFAKNEPIGKFSILSRIGKNLSSQIYIIHPMIKSILKYALICVGAGALYNLFAPVLS